MKELWREKRSRGRHTKTEIPGQSVRVLRRHIEPRHTASGVFTIGLLGPCPLPSLNCERNLAYGKNATKMSHFHVKISNFLGRGIAPCPDPTRTRERNTPDQTPHAY